jgi:hypothetical protein
VCSPAAGSTVGSPVNFSAAAKSSNPITAMRIYIDYTSVYLVKASSLNVSLPVAAGAHHVTVQAWDSAGLVLKTSFTMTVGASTASGSCSASTIGVTICAPAAGTTLGSPVRVTAAAKTSATSITAMRIYVDNVSKYLTNAGTLDTSLSLPAGTHNLVVQAWDSSGAIFKKAETITVH